MHAAKSVHGNAQAALCQNECKETSCANPGFPEPVGGESGMLGHKGECRIYMQTLKPGLDNAPERDLQA